MIEQGILNSFVRVRFSSGLLIKHNKVGVIIDKPLSYFLQIMFIDNNRKGE